MGIRKGGDVLMLKDGFQELCCTVTFHIIFIIYTREIVYMIRQKADFSRLLIKILQLILIMFYIVFRKFEYVKE